MIGATSSFAHACESNSAVGMVALPFTCRIGSDHRSRLRWLTGKRFFVMICAPACRVTLTGSVASSSARRGGSSAVVFLAMNCPHPCVRPGWDAHDHQSMKGNDPITAREDRRAWSPTLGKPVYGLLAASLASPLQ